MVEFVKLADLRRASRAGHQDLREWQFRDEWLNNDTTTVLAWAGDEGCVLHEDVCPHAPTIEGPTAKGRMDEARELFAVEQPNGTFRYFGFCGLCLVKRIPNYGWEPTPRDWQLLDNLRQRLKDMKILDEQPVSGTEMIARMKRYGSANLTPTEFKRLIQFYEQTRGDEEDDLSSLVVLRRQR
jgi:hypothetical protein